jgi:hypothetical protein
MDLRLGEAQHPILGMLEGVSSAAAAGSTNCRTCHDTFNNLKDWQEMPCYIQQLEMAGSAKLATLEQAWSLQWDQQKRRVLVAGGECNPVVWPAGCAALCSG